MRAELGLPSVKGDDETGGGMTGGFGGSMGGAGAMGKSKRPINVKFEIPYFTTSGIQVRYLKITEPKVCRTYVLLLRSFLTNTVSPTAPVSVLAMGPLHHTIRRHCRPHARCSIGVRGSEIGRCESECFVQPRPREFQCLALSFIICVTL